jgi:hypothetical protein
MHRYSRILFAALLVPLLIALLSASGCGKSKRQRGGDEDEGDGKAAATSNGGGGGVGGGEKKAVVAKGYATLKGKVMFKGNRDFAAADKAIKDQMQAQNDHATCLAGDARQTGQQDWIISPDGGLANVLVSLKPSGNDFFQLTAEEIKKKNWPDVVVVDQPHCAFMPRVSVLFPEYKDATSGATVGSGQKFKVHNSAPVPHNTAWEGDPLKNPTGSQTLPPAKSASTPSEIEVKFKPQRDPVNIKCDIHKWMNGKIWVLNHPYAAVTKGDHPKDTPADWGTYEIRDVPAGVKLNIVVWHEAGGQQTREITLNAGDTKEENFTVAGK